jgi:hypothetical protein
VHITCSQEETEDNQQQQQQDSQQANGTAAASSSSSSGPCAQLLAEWRQSGLPEPKVTWKVTAADDSDSDDEADGNGDAAMTDAAAAAAKVAKRQRRLQQRQQQQQLGGSATGVTPAGPPESWIVLGIESSCDDTAAAVVRGDGTVLSHCIASQVGAVVLLSSAMHLALVGY